MEIVTIFSRRVARGVQISLGECGDLGKTFMASTYFRSIGGDESGAAVT